MSDFESAGTIISGNSFVVFENGTYTVYAKDNAGNAAIKTVMVDRIDAVSPTVSFSVSSNWVIGKKTITATVVNDTSGVQETKWLSGSQLIEDFSNSGTTFTSTFDVLTAGTYTVYAIDNAGNESVYILDVPKNNQSISFTASEVTQTYTPGFIFSQTPTVSSGIGAISYEIIGGTGVASINASTGEISNVTKTGTISVKVTNCG